MRYKLRNIIKKSYIVIASLTILPQDGWTPLHYAIHEGRLEIVKLLVESGANIHTGDKVHENH